MSYPPLPVKKQYKDWFPDIPVRPVPLVDNKAVVTNSSLAMQPEQQGGSTAEVFSPPKKIEFGALKLWLEGGEKTSTSYDDGPDFDWSAHSLENDDPAAETAFNFASGSEESKIKVCWEVFGKQDIASAKLELFCKSHPDPIWEFHWGDAWGKKKAEIAAFPATADGDFAYKGEYAFSNIKPDKTLKLKNAVGDLAEAFPKEILTLAHSPYQLRLTVSGGANSGEKAEKDKCCYPMTAWTYAHVLLHSFTFEFGKLAWLKDQRDDIDKDFKDAVIGTRKSDIAKEYGLEGGIVEDLRQAVSGKDDWSSLTHSVSVTVNHTTKRNNRGNKGEDTDNYEKMWGLGPRIPLIAKPFLMAIDGTKSDAKAADATVGAAVLWDWDDSYEKDRWKKATLTPTTGDATLTQDFLARLHDGPSRMFHPDGSSNCPVKRGGKYGDVKAPLFMPQDQADTTGNGLPFKVKSCETRMWAAVSLMDAEGQTGLMVQPARQAGDSYAVSAYLMQDGMDTDKDISDMAPYGEAGTFEVFRRLDVFHVVVGALPDDYGTDMAKDAKAKAKSQCWLDLRMQRDEVSDDDYGKLMTRAIELEAKNSVGQFDFFGLEIPRMLKLDATTSAFLNLRSRADFDDEVKKIFKNGKARLVKTQSADFHFNQGGVKRNDGSMGIPVYLEQKDKDGNDVCFLLSEPGKGAVADKESAKVWGTEKAATLELALPDARSCWEATIVLTKNTKEHGKHVKVKFPGGGEADLEFTRAWNSTTVGSDLADKNKEALRTKFIAASKAFDDGETFAIKIEGHQGTSATSKARITNIKNYLSDLVKERVIIERKILWEEYRKKASSGTAKKWCDTTGKDGLFMSLVNRFAQAYVEKKNLTAGQVMIQASRFSSLSDYEEDRKEAKEGKNGAVAWTDYPTGGSVDGALQDQIDLGLVYLITPDPTSDGFAKNLAGKTKKAWAILLHELGHGMCLNHADRAPGREKEIGAPSVVAKQHVSKESCIMSYDSLSDQYCGMCMLRIRGWKWFDLENAVKPPTLSLEFSIGDPNRVFLAPFGTSEGLRERLQVLGLFNRPLDLYEDPEFLTEYQECVNYSVKLARKLVLNIDTDEETMNQALCQFWFSGGDLPDDDKQARVRVWGHYHPFYANMDLVMRYGRADKKDSKENAFKLMAYLGDVRATYESQNPALGSYPVDITVTDKRGFPFVGAKVFVQLVAPKPEGAWEADSAGSPLVGGKTFVKGTGRKALHTHVAAYETDHIKGYKPGAGDDPQKDNVHADLGGKRGLSTDGDVSTPSDVYNMRNILCQPDAEEAMSLTDTGGHLVQAKNPKDNSPIKHCVMLTADEEGVARFNFTPSSIGGDRYRLRAFVLDEDDPSTELVRGETGDMTIWRTYRIGEYRTMPNVGSKSELGENQQNHMKLRWVRENEAIALGAVTPLDLKEHIGLELAKAYGEVIFDDTALTPAALDKAYWKRFADQVDWLKQRYSDVENSFFEMMKTGFATRLKQETAGGPWKGTIPGPFYPAYVGIALITDPLRIPLLCVDSVAHDYDDALADDAKTGKFRNLATGDSVFGYAGDDWKKGQTGANLKGAGSIDYKTGDVQVEFTEVDLQKYFKQTLSGAQNVFGDLPTFQVRGATGKNTDDGMLYMKVALTANKQDRWDVIFYKSILLDDPSIVARATGVKQNAKGTKASPMNKSGLTVLFDTGNSLPTSGVRTFEFNLGFIRVAALYWPKQVVDHKALIEYPEKSPWLLNYRQPQQYNKDREDGYADAPATERAGKLNVFETISADKTDNGWAETYFMRGLSASLADGQGFCYYPGQLYIHANVCNPLQGAGLGGKGTGNTAFIFQRNNNDPGNLHYLFLHETGHCLYGVHANQEPGYYNEFHDCKNDTTNRCIMAGFDDAKSLKTFCGKCVAGLRGLSTIEEPLYSASLAGKTPKLAKGKSKEIRKPKAAPVDSGLILAITVPDPHVLPLPPVDNSVVVVTAPVTDTITASQWVEDFDLIAQEKSNWCWAAASQMMRKYYLDEDVTQSAIASDALFDEDEVDCSLVENDGKCNKQHALHLIGLNSTSAGVALTWEQIKTEIDADRPFIFASGTHYMIGYGYEEGSAGNKLYYFDPLPTGTGSDTTMTYENYKSTVTGGGATYYAITAK